MKTIAILLLTTSVVTASLPFVLAQSCLDGTDERFLPDQTGALPDGTYLYVQPTDGSVPPKSPVWSEANDVPGLQTSPCEIGGIEYFPADSPAVAA